MGTGLNLSTSSSSVFLEVKYLKSWLTSAERVRAVSRCRLPNALFDVFLELISLK